jgi:hypothetical protein
MADVTLSPIIGNTEMKLHITALADFSRIWSWMNVGS